MEALRASWEVPSIVHYCSLFREAFDLPEVEFEEFEDALLIGSTEDEEESPIILELLIQLLQGCYNREDIVTYNYEHYLSDVINYRWALEEQGTSPIANKKFYELSPRKKAHVIRKLCDYRLDVDDIEAELRGYEAENMRVEPLGFDSAGASYWYFFGVRLYKEDPPPPEPAPPVEEKVPTVQKRSRRSKRRGRKPRKRKVTKVVPKKVEDDIDRRRSSRIRDKQVIEIEEEEEEDDVNDDEDTDVEEQEINADENDIKLEENDIKVDEKDSKLEDSIKTQVKSPIVEDKAIVVEEDDDVVESEIDDLNEGETLEKTVEVAEKTKTDDVKQEDTNTGHSESGDEKPLDNDNKQDDEDESDVKKEPESDIKPEDNKEPPKPEVKPEVKPKVVEDPEPDPGPVRWHLICSSLEDWQGFADGLTLSSAKCERDLSKTIIENFIPEIPRILEEQERRMRKRLAENAPRRISNRLERKRKEQMERESIMSQIHAEEDEMRLRDDAARRVVEEAEEEDKRKQRDEDKTRMREERTKRAELREMRAQMIAEGKEIPPELLYNENSCSSKASNQNGWMDDDMKSLLLAIVDACMSHKEAWPFLEKVDEEYAPGYYDIVKRPMYLIKIEKRVKQRRYACRKEFLADFKLMFNNCYRFNGHDHDISKMGKSLERFFNVTHKRFLPKDDDMFQVDESDTNYHGSVPRQTGRVFKKYLPRREAGNKALEILHETARNGHGDNELSLMRQEDEEIQEIKVKMPKTETMLRCLNSYPRPVTIIPGIRPNILSRPRIISPTNQMRIIGQNTGVRQPPARVTIMSPGGTPKTIPISGPNSPAWLQNLLANSKIDPSKAKIYIANSPSIPGVRPSAATTTTTTVPRFSSPAVPPNLQNALGQPGIRTTIQNTPTGPVKIVHLVYKPTVQATVAPILTTAPPGSDLIKINGALVSPNTAKQLIVPSSTTGANIPVMQVVSNSNTTHQFIRHNAPTTTVMVSQPQAQQTVSQNLINAIVNQGSPLKSTTILTAPVQGHQQVNTSINIPHTPTKSVQIIGNTLRVPRPQLSTASQILSRMKTLNPETEKPHMLQQQLLTGNVQKVMTVHNTVTSSEPVFLANNVSRPAAPTQVQFVSATPAVAIQQNNLINPLNSGSQLQVQNLSNNNARIAGNTQPIQLQTSPVKSVNVNILNTLSNLNNQQHIISNQSNSGIQFQNVSQSNQNTILISSQSAGGMLQTQSSSPGVINIVQPQINQMPRAVIQPVQTSQIVTSIVQTVSNSVNQYGIQVKNGTHIQPGTVVIQPTVPSSPIVKSHLYNLTNSNLVSSSSTSSSIPGTIVTTLNPSQISTQHRISIPTTSVAAVKRKLSSGENEHATPVHMLQISPNKFTKIEDSPERNIFSDANVIFNDQITKLVPVQVEASNARTVTIPQPIQNSVNITQNRNVIQLIPNSGLGGKLLVNNSPSKVLQVPSSILTATSSPSFVLKATNSVQLTGPNVRPVLSAVNVATNIGNPQAIGLNPAKKVLFIPNIQSGGGHSMSGVTPIVQTSASNIQQANMATSFLDSQATVLLQAPDLQLSSTHTACVGINGFLYSLNLNFQKLQFETVPAASQSAISLGQSVVQTGQAGQQADNFMYISP